MGIKIELSEEEKTLCLRQIRKRLVKSLGVYEQFQDDKNQGYKEYIERLIIFIMSADDILDNSLVMLKVNLNSILQNKFNKRQFKSIIFECMNHIDYLLATEAQDGKDYR